MAHNLNKIIFVTQIVSLTAGTNLTGQIRQQAENFQLNIPIGQNCIYEAKNEVRMKDGFSFKSYAGVAFDALINNSLTGVPVSGGNGDLSQGITSGYVNGTGNAPPGTLPGAIDVSPAGTATYNISLDFPKGLGGISPRLSVVYRSNAGNGLLGLKWDLEGISKITRVQQSKYYDNTNAPVTLTLSDCFALDGQRLILTSGTNGTDGSTYAKESDDFSVITVKGNSTTGPEYFELKTKDGTTITYGQIDSKLLVPGTQGGITAAWYIKQITDRRGNWIVFYYDSPEGQVKLREIDYTGNDAAGITSIPCYVRFGYENLLTSRSYYIAGYQFTSTLRLKSIEISDDRYYEFGYDASVDKLLSISLKKGSNLMCNPTQITWGTGADVNSDATAEEASDIYGQFKKSLIFFGDFNNDGIIDVVKYNDENKKITVSINDNDYDLPLPIEEETSNVDFYIFSNLYIKNIMIEKTASGKDQIGVHYILTKYFELKDLSKSYTPCQGFGTAQKFYYYNELIQNFTYNGSGFQADDTFSLQKSGDDYGGADFCQGDLNPYGPMVPIPGHPHVRKTMPHYQYTVYSGDINNDGYQERIITEAQENSQNPIIYEITKSDGSLLMNNVGHVANDIVIFDYDGDGQNELLALDNSHNFGSGTIYKFNGSGLVKMYSNDTIFDQAKNLFFGDFNGDGLTDFLNMRQGTRAGLYLFNGVDYVKNDLPADISNLNIQQRIVNEYDGDPDPNRNTFLYCNFLGDYGTNGGYITNDPTSGRPVKCSRVNCADRYFTSACIKTADINKDGKSDIVYAKGNSVVCLISNDNNGYDKTEFLRLFDKDSDLIYGNELHLIDLDNDGQLEVLYRASTNLYGSYHDQYGLHVSEGSIYASYIIDWESLLGKQLSDKYYVSKIKNGQGVESSIKHSYYKNNNEITNTSDTVYELHGPFRITSNVTTTYPTGSTSTLSNINYNYSTLLVHQQKGLIGFMTFTAENTTNTEKAITTLDYDKQFFTPYAKTIVNYMGGIKISTKTNTLYSVSRTSPGYFAYLSTIELLDNLTNIKTSVEVNFDESNGNLNTKKETFGNDGNIFNTYSSYDHDKPQTITTVRAQGASSFTTTQNLTYTTEGNILTSTDNNGNITTYEYCSDNTNVYKITYPKCDEAANAAQEILTYDNSKRYVINKQTSVGSITATETYEYDDDGNPTRTKDKNGLITDIQYDIYDKLIVSLAPNGRREVMNYGWASLSDKPEVKSYCQTKDDMGNTITSYFDALGREVYKANMPALGKVVTSYLTYNEKGQLLSENSSLDGITSYVYRSDGRVQSVTTIHGTTNYSYVYATATSQYNGVTKFRTVNAFSQISAVTDPGGTITYTFHPTGNISSVSLNGSTISSMGYNAKGYQTSLIEPNAGTSSYTYNNLGMLKTQSDGNSNSTTLYYDDFGRVYKKSIVNGSKTFIINYNFSNDAKGLLTSEVSTDENGKVVTAAYEYDRLGNVTKSTKTIENTLYIYYYEYDIDGRLTKTTYPSGEAISQSYTGSLLTDIKDAQNTSIFSCSSSDYDKWGHITNYTLGVNNVTNVFDPTYGWLTSATYGPAGNRITYGYSYEPVMDNLTSKSVTYANTAKGTSQTESFTYDKMDRLTGWTIGTTQYNTNYEANGNIVQKTNMGYYTYDQTKPNAIFKVDQSNVVTGITTSTSNMTYNLINKVSGMTLSSSTYNIDYGPDEQRTVSTLTLNPTSNKTIYAGLYEWRSNGDRLHYIEGPNGLCALLVTNDAGTKRELYYLYTDYLGSITAVANSTGNIVKEFSYDPWGSYSNPANWNDYNTTPDTLGASGSRLITRGFTGQEYVPGLDLYNMNARFYDPHLGRFLSPDNIVQDAYNTQCYNRYTYCLNNPLKYIDPTGFSCEYKFDLKTGEYEDDAGNVVQWSDIERCIRLDHEGTGDIYNNDDGSWDELHYYLYYTMDVTLSYSLNYNYVVPNTQLDDGIIPYRYLDADNMILRVNKILKFMPSHGVTSIDQKYSVSYNNVDIQWIIIHHQGLDKEHSPLRKSKAWLANMDNKYEQLRKLFLDPSAKENTSNDINTMSAAPGGSSSDFRSFINNSFNNVSSDNYKRLSTPEGGEGGNGVDNAANVVGAIEFSYNMAVDAHPNASTGVKGVGNGLKGLNIILGGLRVYDQYVKGGIKNVSPADATSVVFGTIGVTAKYVSWLGYGGKIVSCIGGVADGIGIPLTIYQLWSIPYKMMDELRYAPPSKINVDQYGEPAYFQNSPGDW